MSGISLTLFGLGGNQGDVRPGNIPNISLWYNASASATVLNGVSNNNFNSVVTDGTSIGSWNDLSGAGHAANVNGGTTKEPNYAANIQNGQGAVLYTSANSENLDINPLAWSQNLSGFTLYVVARPTVLPLGTSFPLVATDTSLGLWWNGTNWSAGLTAGNNGSASITDNTSKFHIYGLVFDGSATGNANRLKFRYDRLLASLSFTGTIPTTTGSPAYMYFGGDNRSGAAGGALATTYMDGYIGEVLIWTRTLSLAEIGSVELYLNTKWNLGLT